eukprot:4092989-Pleurochrysis_carterae.AAC.4
MHNKLLVRLVRPMFLWARPRLALLSCRRQQNCALAPPFSPCAAPRARIGALRCAGTEFDANGNIAAVALREVPAYAQQNMGAPLTVGNRNRAS